MKMARDMRSRRLTFYERRPIVWGILAAVGILIAGSLLNGILQALIKSS